MCVCIMQHESRATLCAKIFNILKDKCGESLKVHFWPALNRFVWRCDGETVIVATSLKRIRANRLCNELFKILHKIHRNFVFSVISKGRTLQWIRDKRHVNYIYLGKIQKTLVSDEFKILAPSTTQNERNTTSKVVDDDDGVAAADREALNKSTPRRTKHSPKCSQTQKRHTRTHSLSITHPSNTPSTSFEPNSRVKKTTQQHWRIVRGQLGTGNSGKVCSSHDGTVLSVYMFAFEQYFRG